MREILFRGKRVDNGEWVQGSLFAECSRFQIIRGTCNNVGIEGVEVIPETVGQYTGLSDKNGKKIFEGDIVKGKDTLEKDFEVYGYVDHLNGSFVIIGDIMTHYRWLDYDVEIIGNIHDNPELLGDK